MRPASPCLLGLCVSLCFACGPADDDDGAATAVREERGGPAEVADEIDEGDEDEWTEADELADLGAIDEAALDPADLAEGSEDGALDEEPGIDASDLDDVDPAPDEDVRAAAVVDAEPSEAELVALADEGVRTKRFRVFDWNIAGGKENACATTGIKRAVMRFVREANGPVDFVSLNEVCPAQYTAIREALRRHWGKSDTARFAAYASSGGARVGNAIFSRRNLRKVTRSVIGHDQYGDRSLLCGRQVGRRVRVCSTHLTPADAKARVQLDRVLERIEAWWVDKRDTVIIAGDLNLNPNDPGLNAMYAADANTQHNPDNRGKYRELDDDDGDHCRGYGERTLPGTSGGPCGDGGKIDFIFARANRIVSGQYGADALEIPDTCTGACSDHRAIRGWADLRFRVD